MRSLKELIPLLIEELKTGIYTGICCAINDLYYYKETIALIEYAELKTLIKKAKPNIFMKRYYCDQGGCWSYGKNYFYWTPGEMEPRIKWLQKQLKKLK